jgi:tRNA(His) guanylyltransferase
MKKGKDEFGDRMKMYEFVETGRRFIPLLPVIARLDGRSFSKVTKGFARPYDDGMVKLMIATTQWLVEETNALIGYTQSDEISLVFYSDNIKSQIFFDGRMQKMISVLAGIASSFFTRSAPTYLTDRDNCIISFDCKMWQLPNKTEATNAIFWRELDATKNSVSMAAREYYSHKELFNKNRADMMDMLMEKGVNWNNYPSAFKRGTYVQRRKIKRRFTEEELQNLPKKHQALLNPDLEVERTSAVVVDMPPLSKVLNRVEVIFYGAEPIIS